MVARVAVSACSNRKVGGHVCRARMGNGRRIAVAGVCLVSPLM